MKILHFSDIHIGKKLGATDVNEEYRAILDEIAEHAAAFGAELAVISGDLLERGADTDAERILVSALLKLSANGRRPVVALAGRCDDKTRLSVLKEALAASNIFLITEPAEKLSACGRILSSGKGYAVIETTGGETAAVGFLPYFENDTDYKTTALKYIEGASKGFGENHINIFAAYIGIEDTVCDDGRQELPQSILPVNADYTALGGSHKIQLLDHGRSIIYSGAILGDIFEESKNKDKNAKKIIAAKIDKNSEIEKNVIKLAASKPLVKITAASPEQALAALADASGCLVSINLNMSVPLSVVEYKSLLAAHGDISEIRLNMPPKVIKERHRLLRAGSAAEFFRNYYRTRYETEPPRELAQTFSRLAKTAPFNINGNAKLDKIELKNLLTKDGTRAAEMLSGIFYIDEFCRGILYEIKNAEEAALREYEDIAETGYIEEEIAAIDEELAEAAAIKERAAVAKGILPEFEAVVALEKDFKVGAQKLDTLKNRQRKLPDISGIRKKIADGENEEKSLKEETAKLNEVYNQNLSELRALEKELALTERTIDMQLRNLEKPAASPEAVSWLSQAVIHEEVIKIYTETIARLEKKIRETEANIETAQKNLAAYTKAEQDIAAVVGDTRKNILSFAPVGFSAENELEAIPAALQKNYEKIQTDISKAKEIAAEIKKLIAENETETQLLKQTLDEISEQTRLKKQQQDLITGTEHRLERLYKQKDEQIGLNYFARIANSVKENEQCLLCGEKVRRQPAFTEINTASLDSEVVDARAQLREAYDRRDEITVTLSGKESVRDKCKARLEEIVVQLKALKAERIELIREGDDERRITDKLNASDQSIRKVKGLFRVLEERRSALSAAERKVVTETGILNSCKNACASYKEQHSEYSSKLAEAVFAYSKIKSALGRDDIKRIETEITDDFKRRGNSVQNIVSQEGVRIQTLNGLRKLEKALHETEAQLSVAENKIQTIKEAKAGHLALCGVWEEIENEIKEHEDKQSRLSDKIKDQKNIFICAMIAGGYKSGQELKKAVSSEATALFTAKVLEDRKKKLQKQIAEAERRAQETKESGDAETLAELKEIFTSGDIEKAAAEEYFGETAAAASAKMSVLSNGRYNIDYIDGFATLDNFAGGKAEKITALNEQISQAFDL